MFNFPIKGTLSAAGIFIHFWYRKDLSLRILFLPAWALHWEFSEKLFDGNTSELFCNDKEFGKISKKIINTFICCLYYNCPLLDFFFGFWLYFAVLIHQIFLLWLQYLADRHDILFIFFSSLFHKYLFDFTCRIHNWII